MLASWISSSTAHIHLVLLLNVFCYDAFINEGCLTSQKIPEYPTGQLQAKVLPSFSTHCPPCRQGVLSQGLGSFWQYFPENPGGHKHLDPDTWSYVGQYMLFMCNRESDYIKCGKGDVCHGSATGNETFASENKYCSDLEVFIPSRRPEMLWALTQLQ